MFLNPFPNAFGLDISDRSLKLIQLQASQKKSKKNEEYIVETMTAIPLSPSWIEQGEIVQPEPVAQAVRQLFSSLPKNHKKSPWVIASIPDTQCFVRSITLPVGSAEEMRNSINEKIEKEIPYDPAEVYTDWYELPGSISGNRSSYTTVLIAATPKVIADSYTYLLEAANLVPLALEPAAIATARSIIEQWRTEREHAEVILDVGANATSVIIFDHGIIMVVSTIPFGTESLRTQIEKELNVATKEADRLIIQCGFDVTRCEGKLKKFTEGQLERLAKHIQTTLTFYTSHATNPNPIAHILLSGGGANIFGLDQALSGILKIPTQKGDPWMNTTTKKQEGFTQVSALTYATGIGLALRACRNKFFTPV